MAEQWAVASQKEAVADEAARLVAELAAVRQDFCYESVDCAGASLRAWQ